MPRPVADQEGPVKPFEYRVGVGGLPAWGGMFRAGDPAVIPSNKFHLLVNVRITPSGMVNRPGLVLEYDTGAEECIDGITGLESPGATALLWPGAGVGGVLRNNATLREIRPRAVGSPSEYKFVTLTAPAEGPGLTSSVLSVPLSTYDGGPLWPWTEPFFFRGELCVFDDGYRILKVVLPGASGKQANDCQRAVTWSTPMCPAKPDLTGTLWPRGYPFGATQVITDFPVAYSSADWQIESFLVSNERDDNALTTDVGIHEFLYVLLYGRAGGAEDGKRVLLRYSGATWSLEFTPPDGLSAISKQPVTLGQGRNGPILVSMLATDDWSAYRSASGSWVTIAGTSTLFTSGDPWGPINSSHRRGITGQGKHGIVVVGKRRVGAVTFMEGAWMLEQDSVSLNEMIFGFAIAQDEGFGIPLTCYDWTQAQGFVYVLTEKVIFSNAYTGLAVGGFLNVPTEPTGSPPPSIWMQEVGGRVLLGGKFVDFNFLTQTPDPGVTRHAVYDVTDQANLEALYEVKDTEQTDDTEAERYSLGCLPSFPQQVEGTD